MRFDQIPQKSAMYWLWRHISATITSITFCYLPSSMPIDIERFDENPEDTLRARGPTNAENILAFLASHPDQAFTPKEIHQQTRIPRGSVGVVLSRLRERDLLRHRGEYWAIAEDAETDKTLAAMSTARAATEQLGPEDPEEWGPGVDSEAE